MSRHAAVDLDWADGSYTFRLGLKEVEELEDKADCGIFQIYVHLGPARTFRSNMLVETIRIGLIGGGLEPIKALGLVRKYIEERPIDESRDVAFAVVSAALSRVHGDELKKAAEGGTDDAGKPETEE